MLAKWLLRGLAVASAFAGYDCRRRSPVPPPAPPAYSQPGYATPVQPGYAPGYAQPGAPQPGYGQPSYPQPGYPQPGYPQPGNVQPGYPQPTYPQPVPQGDFVAQQMAMRQAQFAQGMAPVLPLTRGSLATSAVQNYAVPMQSGHCYKIIGVGGMGVSDLDLVLYSPTGARIDQDLETDNYPVLGLNQQHPLCPSEMGTYRLEVRMYAGAGEYGVQVFSN